MDEIFDSPKVTMTIVRGCLVVPIQVELYDETIIHLQQDILEKINEKGIKGVIIDFCAVDIIDPYLAQKIVETVNMMALMGAESVLTGFKPEVAASLVDFDISLDDIQAAIDHDDAFIKLRAPVMGDVERETDEKDPGEETDEKDPETDKNQLNNLIRVKNPEDDVD